MLHNADMPVAKKVVRQSISLPADIAHRVQSIAKARRLSSNRMLVELVEDGLAARERKQHEFFALAERFRAATEKKEAARLLLRGQSAKGAAL
jgi:predicted transcriptional regulator